MVALRVRICGALRRANACIAINECAWTDAMAALRFENYTRRMPRGRVARSSRVHWWRQRSSTAQITIGCWYLWEET
jgi:hypothetical protein